MEYDDAMGSIIDQIVQNVQQQKQKPATAEQEKEVNPMQTSADGKWKNNPLLASYIMFQFHLLQNTS